MLEKVEKDRWGNSARNAHSKTAEKLDMKVGQWSFCKNFKDQECVSNFIISFLFLIQHNFLISRLSSGAANNISERLTGRKPVRSEVTSERVYCRIISVGRAIARSYWYYPQYTILLTVLSSFVCGVFVQHRKNISHFT